MITTFTASTINTDNNRSLMCDFINKYSPKCSQMVLTAVGNVIVIEAATSESEDKIRQMAKQIPAKVVVLNIGNKVMTVNNEIKNYVI